MRLRTLFTAVAVVALLSVAWARWSTSGHAQDSVPPLQETVVASDAEAASATIETRSCPEEARLARHFAPALAIAPDDQTPRPIEAFLDRAELVYRDGDHVAQESRVDVARLAALRGNPEAYLKLPPATDDRLAQQRLYEEVVAGDTSGRYGVTAYARVHCAATTAGMGEFTVLQYWLFYLYNNASNMHEGDWELVQIVLGADRRPLYAAYAQHNTYSWRHWDEVLLYSRETSPDDDPGEHPRVYVARGSHASYFQYAPNGYGGDMVADARELLIPTIRLLPGTPNEEPGFGWLRFAGRWGESPAALCKGCDAGPVGPMFNSNGTKWKAPLEWGGQRLTRDDLLTNRTARLIVTGKVQTHLYDEQQRHTGPLLTGRLELGIPGAAHLTRPGSTRTIVLLPNFTERTLGRIEITGGEMRSLRVLIPGEAATDVQFPRVVLDLTGVARIQLGRGALVLQVDTDGDGTFERTVYPLISEPGVAPERR